MTGEGGAAQRSDFLKHPVYCYIPLVPFATLYCCKCPDQTQLLCGVLICLHLVLLLSLLPLRSGTTTSCAPSGWKRTVYWPGAWTEPPEIMAPGRAQNAKGPHAGCRILSPETRAVLPETKVSGERWVQCDVRDVSGQLFSKISRD